MIPFSPPHIDQEIIDAVVDTLKSGWITTGPKTKLFEKQLTAYCGNKSTLCLNSATSGLEIILRWFGLKEGDEVILPAYTFSATANVIIHCGAKPVFVDVKEDFNMDPAEVRKAITSKTKVILPVDIGGMPCDYDELNSLMNSEETKSLFKPAGTIQQKLGRILVLSDAAHSLGSTYKGKKTGSLTDISVFSFHAVKNLTTAEGGALALNLPPPFDNQALYEELCIKTLHGQSKDALAKTKPGNWKYDIVEAGYKMNMTDVSASMGLVELGRYDKVLAKRKELCEVYSNILSKHEWAILPQFKTDQKESSYHLYMLRIKGIDETKRDAIISRIFKKQVSANVHFIPVPMLSFYRNLGYDIGNYPRTYDLYQNEISLPLYYDLSLEQVKQVCDAVVEAVGETI